MAWQLKWGNNVLVNNTNGTFQPFTKGYFKRIYDKKKLPLGNFGFVFDMGLDMIPQTIRFSIEVAKSNIVSKENFFQGLSYISDALTLSVPEVGDMDNCILETIQQVERKKIKKMNSTTVSLDGYLLAYEMTFTQIRP